MITRQGLFAAIPGLVGMPSMPKIFGDRSPDFRADAPGSAAFTAKSGDRFAHFRAENVGNGLVRCKDAVDGLVMEHLEVVNAYRVLETTKGKPLTGFRLSDIKVRGVERGLARIWDGSRGLIEDVEIDGENQVDDPFAMAIHFEGVVTDTVVQRVKIRNIYGPKAEYPNGDGVAQEGGCKRNRFLDIDVKGVSDAGLDLKGEAFADRCTVEDAKRSYRAWGEFTAGTLTSVNPRDTGFWVGGKGTPNARVEMMVWRHANGRPLIGLDTQGRGSLSFGGYRIEAPAGTPLFRRESSAPEIDWGPQGPPPNKKGLLV